MMELIEELTEELVEQEAGNVGDGAYVADLLRRASAKIKRLQAVVDKLPKTADAVPLLPGMMLWYRNATGFISTLNLQNWADVVSCLDDQGCSMYSTREAAEAAGRER